MRVAWVRRPYDRAAFDRSGARGGLGAMSIVAPVKPKQRGIRPIAFVAAILFLGAVGFAARWLLGDLPGGMFAVVAAMIGGYMAMNIGANDVANNVGPSVGSGALTLVGALALGAIVAGGEVVGTIRSGIIDPSMIDSPETFMYAMMASLLAAALWINVATSVGAPVSTTHSIVGAVAGAGIASTGFAIANWDVIGRIVASWVVSPLMGAVFAALFLYAIKRTITYQVDLAVAAKRWVPVLVGFMGSVFAVYMMMKGLSRLWAVGLGQALVVGAVLGVVVYAVVRRVLPAPERIENSKVGVNTLFNVPLVFAAALLSFAHGSNDVANAIGPLAAIIEILRGDGTEIAHAAPIPLWVMLVGAVGLAVGLWLFGARVVRTVGSEITEMDQMRAYCIAMSATITVLIASELGLPVSTTHVCVGAVAGVGFLREYLKINYARMVDEIKEHHPEGDQAAIDAFLERFTKAPIKEKGRLLKELKVQARQQPEEAHLSKAERKGIRKLYRQELVKRSLMIRIAAAWVITVPSSALMAAVLFFTVKGFMM